MRCPTCGADGDLRSVPGHEVTVGTIAAQLERRPVVACPDDHQGTPAELVGAAMEAVDDQVARARGRVLRGDVCRACGTPAAMPVRRTARTITLDPPAGPVLTLHLDLPMTRCGGCGIDQVPSRSHEDLTVVVPAVFAPDLAR